MRRPKFFTGRRCPTAPTTKASRHAGRRGRQRPRPGRGRGDPRRSVGDQVHAAQAPGAPRDGLELAARHDEVLAEEAHAPRPVAPALEPLGFVRVEAVLVVHVPSQPGRPRRQDGVHRAPVVGEQEIRLLLVEEAPEEHTAAMGRARLEGAQAQVDPAGEVDGSVRPSQATTVRRNPRRRRASGRRAHPRPCRAERREDVEEAAASRSLQFRRLAGARRCGWPCRGTPRGPRQGSSRAPRGRGRSGRA